MSSLLGSAEQMGAEEGGAYDLYAAATFNELVRPHGPIWFDTDRAWRGLDLQAEDLLDRSVLEGTCDEATMLYLHDQPDLRTLADSAPEFCYTATQVDPALQRGDWAVTFNMKAWMRFAKVLGLKNSEPQFIVTYREFSQRLLGSVDVFKGLRPAFSAS